MLSQPDSLSIVMPMPTNNAHILNSLKDLRGKFQGDVLLDNLDCMVYSTDASVYQETPLAVVCPRNEDDVQLIIQFARNAGIGLIPRAAGTSLAGQVVGSGIVVDVSRYMNHVLEVDVGKGRVRVQPGVIRDELNQVLASHGLFFGPETSTSNRATLGGMLGNNSCGSNSIAYGSTRDHVVEVAGYLADGSRLTLGEIGQGDLASCVVDQPRVIADTIQVLAGKTVQAGIRSNFPDPAVTRRNTGYALDRLIECAPFQPDGPSLNLCQLIAGSEGTLFFVTEITLQCQTMPPEANALFCPHFHSVHEALKATQIVMKGATQSGGVYACELVDQFILAGAQRNPEQRKNLQFVSGTPQAILIIDFRAETDGLVQERAGEVRNDLEQAGLGYDYPLLFGESIGQVWQLRRAGLGVVGNVAGDAKPVTVIEDAAVALEVLPDFISEVNELLNEKYGVQCVHYGHAGAGELHLRPVINLKTIDGVARFRQIAGDVAAIVKKYGGSLSGEHGDGRLRGEFLGTMIGQENYRLLKRIKQIWDPANTFNPGKIIDTPSMTENLRFQPGQTTRVVESGFEFPETNGMQRAAEMCSGSGDCRKTELTGGVMCPSYMATRREKDTTRARANVLRQVMSDPSNNNPLADDRIRQVMDLCLSCKGCKSECPSNVDMAKMKAEFLFQYFKTHGVPRRARSIAGFSEIARRIQKVAGVANWLASSRLTAGALKRIAGVHGRRSLPRIHKVSLRSWFDQHAPHRNAGQAGQVILFCDEFTNYVDVPVGVAAIELLERLGYSVSLPDHDESGRMAISQGLLDRARAFASNNVVLLEKLLRESEAPLIGIEPAALLTLRDEYPVLVDRQLRPAAQHVASRAMLIDEFVSGLIEQRKVDSDKFTDQSKAIRLHGHCHQKVLASMKDTIRMLQLPRNYSVKLIPAGCCGMAGAFGYEKEHYDISMKIGELVLFPTVRSEPANSIIAANGTSCRQQILDGTGRRSLHPCQILRDAFVDRT